MKSNICWQLPQSSPLQDTLKHTHAHTHLIVFLLRTTERPRHVSEGQTGTRGNVASGETPFSPPFCNTSHHNRIQPQQKQLDTIVDTPRRKAAQRSPSSRLFSQFIQTSLRKHAAVARSRRPNPARSVATPTI